MVQPGCEEMNSEHDNSDLHDKGVKIWFLLSAPFPVWNCFFGTFAHNAQHIISPLCVFNMKEHIL